MAALITFVRSGPRPTAIAEAVRSFMIGSCGSTSTSLASLKQAPLIAMWVMISGAPRTLGPIWIRPAGRGLPLASRRAKQRLFRAVAARGTRKGNWGAFSAKKLSVIALVRVSFGGDQKSASVNLQCSPSAHMDGKDLQGCVATQSRIHSGVLGSTVKFLCCCWYLRAEASATRQRRLNPLEMFIVGSQRPALAACALVGRW
mmetsp:Transcript_922/g.3243  ORF Transcript_922/g.3243 Transcript_922/m.3243 type:complete len:202 (-) Transcript_922:39-644(-)